MTGNAATDIARAGLCAGCGLCASITPDKLRMAMDAPGYLRPEALAPTSDGEAARIEAVCPGVSLRHDENTARYHPIWGPLVEVRVGHATDPEVRRMGSSGGALSALLIDLLGRGAADYVVQVAADPDHPTLNAVRTSTGRDDVVLSAGSRYAPSAPLAEISAHLERPGRFIFVGKPCDIAGLRNLARVDPRVDAKVVLFVSFMCAGIPSQRGTDEILAKLGTRREDLWTFRYRGDGWPGFATAVTKDGRTARMSYKDSWGGVLSKSLQFRCKICPDGTWEFADVVCADAWYGGESGYPDFDERDGRSLVLSRTVRGEAAVRAAAEARSIEIEPLAVDQISLMQPYQRRRKQLTLSRLAAMALLGRRRPNYVGLGLWRQARASGIVENARSFLGMLRRLVRPGRD